MSIDSDWTDEALIAMYANRVSFIWGPPGVGKTAQLKSRVHDPFWAAHGRPDAPFVVSILATSDPTEAMGLLAIVDGKVIRITPASLSRLFKDGCGTWFMDEFTAAPQATQAAYLRPVQERYVGDAPLPPEVRIVIAANPSDVAAGGSDVVAPMANRVVHIKAGPPSTSRWGDWLCGELVQSAEARKSASLFAAFVRARGAEMLLNMPDDESKRAGPWPSPRSMHSAADNYAAALRLGKPELAAKMVGNCVGIAVAQEFVTFVENVDLPDPRELLEGKVQWKPERHRIDRINATLRACVSEAVNGPVNDLAQRGKLVERAWELLAASADVGATDVAFSAAVPLNEWRIKKSGNPRAMGPVEMKLAPRFFQILAAVSK